MVVLLSRLVQDVGMALRRAQSMPCVNEGEGLVSIADLPSLILALILLGIGILLALGLLAPESRVGRRIFTDKWPGRSPENRQKRAAYVQMGALAVAFILIAASITFQRIVPSLDATGVIASWLFWVGVAGFVIAVGTRLFIRS